MDAAYKWRLYCETEAAWVEGVTNSDTAPGYCFNNNQHTIDEDSQTIIDSITEGEVTIASSEITLPAQLKGFQDLTGHNMYRFGDLGYDVTAGETNIFMEKFDSLMYISGGGVEIPAYIYVNGTKTDMKPEKGDYSKFDLVDIDNVTGYGKSYTISKVARSSNVATVTTTTEHTLEVGNVICVSAEDDTFDDMEVAIASVPSSTTFTYANTGDDVSEKDDSGDVGLIVVLAPFVPCDYNYPNKTWECKCSDAKAVPPGVYLRFTYVSVGDDDLTMYVHYNMRT